jgi:predicted MFS family arabinose efflux permease
MDSFLLLLIAQGFSLSGGYIQTIALSWAAAELGGSTVHLAIYLLACYLPVAALCYPLGRFLDRRAQKPWLLGSESLLAALSLILWLVARGGKLTFTFLWIFGALWGVVRALQTPLYQSLPRRLSKNRDQGTALFTVLTCLARGIGPLLGGLLYQKVGQSAPYFVNFCSFLPSLALLFFLRIPDAKAAQKPRLRPLISPLAQIFLVGFFGVHYNVTFVGLVKEAGFGSFAYGFSLGLLGLGALLGFWLQSKSKRNLPAPVWVGGMGILNFLLPLMPHWALQGGCILLYGVCDFWFFSQSACRIAKDASSSTVTAVMGLYSVATVGAIPLGALLWSASARALGLRPVFWIIGGGLLILALLEFLQRMENDETRT